MDGVDKGQYLAEHQWSRENPAEAQPSGMGAREARAGGAGCTRWNAMQC